MELWEIALREKGLYHIGRSKRDGAPHGSGRYPLGSGDRPYQYKEEAKAEKYRHDELERISQRRSDHFQKSSKKADRYARTYKKEMTKAGRRGLDTTDKAERALDKYQYTQQLESYSYLTDMLEHTTLARMSISELQTDAASLALVSKTFDRLGETKIKEINELAGNNGLRDRKDLEALGRDIRNKAYDKKLGFDDSSNRNNLQKDHKSLSYEEILSKKPRNDLEAESQDLIRMELADRKLPVRFSDFKKMKEKDQARKISDYVGDLYYGEAKTHEFKAALNALKKERETIASKYGGDYYRAPNFKREAVENKHLDNIAGVVLRELGYKDTLENRKYIINKRFLNWD